MPDPRPVTEAGPPRSTAVGRAGVQSVERAIILLEALAAADSPQTMQSLADTVGCSQSTAHRIVVTLTRAELLQFDDETKRYRLGPGISRLAGRRAATLDLGAVARPHIDRLRDELSETVSLWVRSGGTKTCLAVADGPHEIRQIVTAGATAVLELSAGSRILMAQQPRQVIADWAASALPAGSPGEIAALTAEVEGLNPTGAVLVPGNERDPGLSDVASVAAMIRDSHDRMIGALVVAGPATRFTRERMTTGQAAVLRAAASISAAVGADTADASN